MNEIALKDQLRLDHKVQKVFVGFDGYVDSILKVKKMSDEVFTTLSEFGTYIASKSHKSCSLELKNIQQKMGGNMPNFAYALARLGSSVTCVGALGYPEVLPVFSDLEELCEVKSVSNPGYCQALEFDDGKLMLADNADIDELDYDLLLERAGREYLLDTLTNSQMIVLLNWSELKGSLSLWRGLKKDIFPALSGKKKKMFLDLSDCSGRGEQEIQEAIDLIRAFSKTFDVSISFNRNEAEKIAETVGLAFDSVEELSKQLYQLLEGVRTIVHTVDGCYCVENGALDFRKNRYIKKPVLSTGGGDNFNAGFVYGLLCGMEVELCMQMANFVSGFYVSHGYSPDREELIEWIDTEI